MNKLEIKAMGKTRKRQFTANHGAEHMLAMKDEKRYLRELNDELFNEDYEDLLELDGAEDDDFDEYDDEEDYDDYEDYDDTFSTYMS